MAPRQAAPRHANYAWIQHFIHHLAVPNGRGGGVAGFVMSNGSLSSNSGGEGEIRQRIVEADLVDCIVAIPAQLFFTTGIPVCLWFLTRDKTGKNLKNGCPNRPNGRKGETLFIDARKLGTMQTRTLRVLTGGDDGETLLADGIGDPQPDSDIGRTCTPSASGAASRSPIGGTRNNTANGNTATSPVFARLPR